MNFLKLILASLSFIICSSVAAESIPDDQNTTVKSYIPSAHEHCTQLRDFVKSNHIIEGDYLVNGDTLETRLMAQLTKTSPQKKVEPPLITVTCPLDDESKKQADFSVSLSATYDGYRNGIDSGTLKAALPMISFRNDPIHLASFEKEVQQCLKKANDKFLREHKVMSASFGEHSQTVASSPINEKWTLNCSAAHFDSKKAIFVVTVFGLENT